MKSKLTMIMLTVCLCFAASAAFADPPMVTFYANYDTSLNADYAAGNAAAFSGATLGEGKFATGNGADIAASGWLNYEGADNINETEGTIMFWAKVNTSGQGWSTLASIDHPAGISGFIVVPAENFNHVFNDMRGWRIDNR